MNLPLTLLLHFGLLLTFILALRLAGRPIQLRPILFGLGAVLLYWIVSPLGFAVQARSPLLSGLRWNWLGKVFAIVVELLYWKLLRNVSMQEVGLTWKQRRGSLLWAFLTLAVICAFSWSDEALKANGRALQPERLVFQALMPGLDEEFVFRGLLLALFSRGLSEDEHTWFGWSGAACTLLFALGHGLFVTAAGVKVDVHAVLVTGAIGAGLVLLRRQTGSLVLPVVAHNLVNFGNSFF